MSIDIATAKTNNCLIWWWWWCLFCSRLHVS